jgi:DNA invertase Pin-like site-specific DNA recombinase
MKVFGYLRVSGVSQIDGDGPERQRAAIIAFCARNNLEIVRWFFDAVSGAIEAAYRPEFAAMVECGGEVEAIVAENPTRLARDNFIAEVLLAQCRKVSLKVFTADSAGLVDLTCNDNPTATAMRQLFQVFAQWDKAMLVARLRAARERTQRFGGVPAWGMNEREKALQDTMVQLAIKWQAAGVSPTGRIAEALNEAELFNRDGKPWNQRSVDNHVRRLRKQGLLPQKVAQ